MKINVIDKSIATTLTFNRCAYCHCLTSYWMDYCSKHENIVDAKVDLEQDGREEY